MIQGLRKNDIVFFRSPLHLRFSDSPRSPHEKAPIQGLRACGRSLRSRYAPHSSVEAGFADAEKALRQSRCCALRKHDPLKHPSPQDTMTACPLLDSKNRSGQAAICFTWSDGFGFQSGTAGRCNPCSFACRSRHGSRIFHRWAGLLCLFLTP